MTDYEVIPLQSTPQPRRYAATIGFFDGVHLGHRYVLEQLREEAAQRRLGTMVVTFDEHPQRVLGRSDAPALLTDNTEKLSLVADCGIDACVLLHFTPTMAHLSAAEFMREYLHNVLPVDALLIGYDHHFGQPMSGEGFAQYVTYGAQNGIEVLPAHAYAPDTAISGALHYSSSTVRKLLQQGEVLRASVVLGRPYQLEGRVTQGRQNGRKLGFPTANLSPTNAQKLIPRSGVYATRVVMDGRMFPAMTNVGTRPTLNNGRDVTIETHIFDFEGDLYGQLLTLQFVDRLRDEQRFETLAALVHQLNVDARQARRLLAAWHV